jgi:Spy/CpxP family protein refolding chaperone
MNSKALLVILLAASLAGNAAFLMTAFARRSAPPAAALEQLSLTDGQKAKFEGIKRAFQEERAVSHRSMAELRARLADEYGTETPDRQRLLSTSLEMAALQTSMRPKVVDHLLALHGLLTPGQRATLAGMMRAGSGIGAACPGAMLYSPSEHGK